MTLAENLDAAIRAALANTEHGDRPDGGMCHADCCGEPCECGLNEKPRAALLAVLGRHKADEYGDCSACASYDENPVPWPCDTVRDIARELGVPQAGTP